MKNKLPKLTEDPMYDFAKGLAGMIFRKIKNPRGDVEYV